MAQYLKFELNIPSANFSGNDRGTVAVTFALSLVILCSCVAIGMDYGRAMSHRAKLQALADSSALAAVSTIGRGGSTLEAKQTGEEYWQANRAQLPGKIDSPKIEVSSFNGVSTATVQFSGAQPSAFGAFLGTKNIPVSGKAVAQTENITTKALGLNGEGMVWSDPYLNAANSSKTIEFQCSDKWYNLLSDSGLQVNISCYSAFVNHSVIGKFSILLDGHRIEYDNQNASEPDVTKRNPDNLVPGQIKVDGHVFRLADNATKTFFNGGVSFYVNRWNSWCGWRCQEFSTLTIKTAQYNIVITFNETWGNITISAVGAGKCGVPGGLWGQTLAGVNDYKVENFIVPDRWFKAWEFSTSNCITTALGPHLIR